MLLVRDNVRTRNVREAASRLEFEMLGQTKYTRWRVNWYQKNTETFRLSRVFPGFSGFLGFWSRSRQGEERHAREMRGGLNCTFFLDPFIRPAWTQLQYHRAVQAVPRSSVFSMNCRGCGRCEWTETSHLCARISKISWHNSGRPAPAVRLLSPKLIKELGGACVWAANSH